jgi:hypothetical protein
MTFADTFAADLGDRTGTTVDPEEFFDSESVSADLDALQSFLDELDDTDRSTLDIIVTDGVDLAEATDDDGDPAIPGSALLTLAADAAEPLGDLLVKAQQSYAVAIADSGESNEIPTNEQGDANV